MKDLKKATESLNLAEDFDDKLLKTIGSKVIEWFDADEESRREWKNRNEVYMKLALQIAEKKTFPWPDSANVKFPLLTTAAMQFAARAYPTLVPGPRLVQGLVVGQDPDGKKGQSATRVGSHMSYQILWEMEDWEEDMDKLCLILPIVGCAFKKTYYDDLKAINCSHLISPYDFVVDYYAKNLETASRKTHVIHRNKNEIEERIRKGLYLDVELGRPQGKDESKNSSQNKIQGTQEPEDSPATPYKLLEMHTFWDLDEDGYEEPYIFTVDYASQQLLRAVVRFAPEDIKQNDKGEITNITPTEYFTKFSFIPNPDGAFYDLGFGLLLGGINETVNTLTNQLLDAGTLSVLQGGFLGRGIRVKAGQSRFQPGEWKPVDFTGDDIKKHIFAIPAKEPSETLFKLLETLVVSGKELASIAEIFVGKMPGQNTPATTTMATIEQGLKVLTAIIKRIYRALQKEYMKLFRLNGIYLDEQAFFSVNSLQGQQNEQVYKTDYDPKAVRIKPYADPNIVSSSQKLMKVQSMAPLVEAGLINPQVYTQQFLEAIEAENIPQLLQVQPKQDPKMAEIQMKGQQKQQELQMKGQQATQKAQLDALVEEHKAELEERSAKLDAQAKAMDIRFKAMELAMKAQESAMDLKITQAKGQQDLQLSAQEHRQDMEQGAQAHAQTMEHGEQEHKEGLKQSKEASDAKVAATKQQAAAKPKPAKTK